MYYDLFYVASHNCYGNPSCYDAMTFKEPVTFDIAIKRAKELGFDYIEDPVNDIMVDLKEHSKMQLKYKYPLGFTWYFNCNSTIEQYFTYLDSKKGLDI